jgi:hypothetical protein
VLKWHAVTNQRKPLPTAKKQQEHMASAEKSRQQEAPNGTIKQIYKSPPNTESTIKTRTNSRAIRITQTPLADPKKQLRSSPI